MSAVEFDRYGRMKYNPMFHTKHGKVLSEEELEYLCKFWENDGIKLMSFALGKTEMTLCDKIWRLKKKGLYEYYKNLKKYYEW